MYRLVIFPLLFLVNPTISQVVFSAEQIIHSNCDNARHCFVIDLDQDGDKDVLSASQNDDRVAWHENDGSQNFTRIDITTSLDMACGVVAGDLDGDGDIDLAASSFTTTTGRIVWFENDGAQNFTMSTIEVINKGHGISIVDMEGDGDLDLLVTIRNDDQVKLYTNDGSANFTPSIVASGTTDCNSPRTTWIEDIDGDGFMDVLSTSAFDDKIAWYENMEDGTFGPQQIISLDSDFPINIQSFDLDGDGDQDVVAGSSTDKKLVWFENTGGGIFSDENIITISPSYFYDILVNDVNGDGNPDILGVSSASDEVVWFQNMGDGTFSSAIIISSALPSATNVYSSDYDADGDIDVFTVSDESGVSLHQNMGGAIFDVAEVISRGVPDVHDVWASDLDGDGDGDIVTSSFEDNIICWYENLDNNNFGTQQILVEDAAAATAVCTADADGDGDQDIFAGVWGDDILIYIENLGGGSFATASTIASGIDAITEIYPADLNNDGNMDIITAAQLGDEVAWIENLGGGTFGPKNVISTLTDAPRAVFAADLDNDGDLDVLSASQNDGKIAWFENDGTGSFGSLILIDPLDQAYCVYAADIDSDGDQDVVGASKYDQVVWYENAGDGTFGDSQLITNVVDWPTSIVAGDLDNDGDQDIVVSSFNDNRISYFQNFADGIFAPIQILSGNSNEAQEVFLADIDGDTDLDIISASKEDGRVAWFKNYYNNPYQLRGELFVDENNNGVKDESEIGINSIGVLTTPENDLAFTQESGKYFINLNDEVEAVYEVYPQDLEHWAISSDSLTYMVEVEEGFEFADSLDFGLFPLDSLDSLATDLVGGYPRCNTETNYWINVWNFGTTLPSGLIHLELDDSIDYVSASVEPDSIIDQSIYWHYDSLFYFDNELIVVNVIMPTFLSIGDTLSSTLSAVTGSFEDPGFTSSTNLNQVLVCAYDPNDKNATPEGIGENGYILPDTEELEYLIRFQNTGTDTAITVVIEDQLDTDLDWTSFIPVSSSHEMSVDISHTGLVTFTFENIMLPDSNVNELESHGYVKYKISLNEDLPIGTNVLNYAEIYFDENPAIITNTVTHTLFDCNTILEGIEYTTETCQNDSLQAFIPFDLFPTDISWEVLDFEETGDSLSWFADTTGTIDLTVYSANPLCNTDTTVSFLISPTFKDTLDEIEICYGDSVLIFDNFVTEAGVYSDTLETITGCDSVITQALTLFELPSVTFNSLEDETICLTSESVTLTGSPAGGEFAGAGVTEDSFSPSSAGIGEHLIYYFYEDDNGCSAADSVSLLVVDCLGITEHNRNQFFLYPNPFHDYTILTFENELIETCAVTIHNALGQEVYRNENVTGQRLEIQKSELGVGVYVLTVSSSTELLFSAKLIVQ